MTAELPAPHKRPAYEPAKRLLKPPRFDPEMKRPISTVAGVLLILLRVIAGVVVLVGIATGWDAILSDPDSKSVMVSNRDELESATER